MSTWIDYTRRNDPAQPYYVQKLGRLIQREEKLPDVLCFWTKNPGYIVANYREHIQVLHAHGTLVLAQVTRNTGYERLEPNVDHSIIGLGKLVELLGPGKVRARFDPVIVGFTTKEMFQQHLLDLVAANIDQTTTNFLVPSYKGVGALLRKEYNIEAVAASVEKRVATLRWMVSEAAKFGIKVAGCAEIYRDGVDKQVPGLVTTGCSDASWARYYNPKLEFTQHPSRLGCKCCYSDDWGEYSSRSGPACPHQCVYCYAK